MVIRWLCALVCVGNACSGIAATLHVDTFDTGTQGWSGGAFPTLQPGGGPAGEADFFLQLRSVGNNLAAYNIDPRWIGDLTAIGATKVTADLMGIPSRPPLSIRLVLFGPESTDDRWTSAAAHTIPNDGVWRPYIFPLDELVNVQGIGTLAEVLSGTLQVMLRHDPEEPSADGTAVIGTLGIDNLALVGVPEPACAVQCVILLALALGSLRRRNA